MREALKGEADVIAGQYRTVVEENARLRVELAMARKHLAVVRWFPFEWLRRRIRKMLGR